MRGGELLARADVVVYDYLANPSLLDRAPATAKRVYVGKKGFERHATQDDINELLVSTAKAVKAAGGGTIVRLKGGDPFVFGRGGEEALALAQAGIAYEVVPGVTSGVAAAAYAGIPVTHRGVSSSVTFVTGNEDPSKPVSTINWRALAQLAGQGGTLCFYMGMRNLAAIAENLMREGADPLTPAAAIEWGTAARQRTVVSTIEGIASEASRAGLGAPAIVCVGQVVGLREGPSWFELRPLFGKRVAVTRSSAQAGSLSRRLAELGADVVECPAIEISAPDSFQGLDTAIGRLGSYRWIVFTSANGVDAFFERLQFAGMDARALASAFVAAIGPATANRLQGWGIKADVVPDEYRGEAVFAAIVAASAQAGMSIAGSRVLIPRAQVAREALPDLLREAGAEVDVVAAYKTVSPAHASVDALADLLQEGKLDAVTFASPSAVRNLVELLGERAGLLASTTLASIGPITSAALRDVGLSPSTEAKSYTADGLVDSLLNQWALMRKDDETA